MDVINRSGLDLLEPAPPKQKVNKVDEDIVDKALNFVHRYTGELQGFGTAPHNQLIAGGVDLLRGTKGFIQGREGTGEFFSEAEKELHYAIGPIIDVAQGKNPIPEGIIRGFERLGSSGASVLPDSINEKITQVSNVALTGYQIKQLSDSIGLSKQVKRFTQSGLDHIATQAGTLSELIPNISSQRPGSQVFTTQQISDAFAQSKNFGPSDTSLVKSEYASSIAKKIEEQARDDALLLQNIETENRFTLPQSSTPDEVTQNRITIHHHTRPDDFVSRPPSPVAQTPMKQVSATDQFQTPLSQIVNETGGPLTKEMSPITREAYHRGLELNLGAPIFDTPPSAENYPRKYTTTPTTPPGAPKKETVKSIKILGKQPMKSPQFNNPLTRIMNRRDVTRAEYDIAHLFSEKHLGPQTRKFLAQQRRVKAIRKLSKR